MTLFSADHYDLMAAFEQQYSHLRLGKEPKNLWSMGVIYQAGDANALFLAFRRGASYGKAVEG